MKIKFRSIFFVVVLSFATVFSFLYLQGPKYAGIFLNKGVVPISVVFGSLEAHSTYNEFCSHLLSVEEITTCTATIFASQQIEELECFIYNADFVTKYVVLPKVLKFWEENGNGIKQFSSDTVNAAFRFWDENGDAIKQGASDAANAAVNMAADGFIALDNWLNK